MSACANQSRHPHPHITLLDQQFLLPQRLLCNIKKTKQHGLTMNLISLTCFFAFVIVFSNAQEGSRGPVNVQLYYESLCPDSINLIRDELYPTWQSLKNRFNVDWLPYGKASHRKTADNTSYTFQCQHGPRECRGNMMMACGIDVLTSPEDRMKWIHCVMTSPSPNTAGQRCATSLQLDYNPIQTCEQSNRGKQLLATYGDRTHALRPRLSFVPTVTFNGTYNRELQRRSLRDFRA
ncbi:hypothetical protein B566_EDAN006974, partial [Ephemera danica]